MKERGSEAIAVVTFSRDRAASLARCVRSVRSRRGAPPVVHYVASERAAALRDAIPMRGLESGVRWLEIENPYRSLHPSVRLARLRQEILGRIGEPLICFLDDDNEVLPDHLASLYRLLTSADFDLVHCWRRLRYPDGRPFTGDHYPWHPDRHVAVELHAWCLDNDVLRRGDSVVRDGPRDPVDPRNVAGVDMNEWLFPTELLRRVGFDDRFTTEELAAQVGEDDKLLARILRAGLRIGCTGKATVLYTLGGESNRRTAGRAATTTLEALQ